MEKKGILINLASPQMIKKWADQKLIIKNKNNKITNPQTVDYQKAISKNC